MSSRISTSVVYELDDLERPQLPVEMRTFNRLPSGIAARVLPIEEESLLRAARHKAGYHDFGSDDFREPLRLMLADLNDDDRITPLGRVTVRSVLTQVLETRLRIQEEMTRPRPTPLSPVVAPLFIVGLPRTGTTHLHNLLAQVPALRFLPLWRSIAPFPATRGLGQFADLRRWHTRFRLMAIDRLLPRLRAMHAMEVDLPHEELQLCAPALRSFFFESSFDLPRYRGWYAGRLHPIAYEYLRGVLELLQVGEAPRRWVLKSPQHLDQLPALVGAFPDATILCTRRDPARSVLSLITMIVYARRAVYGRVDVAHEARVWTERLAGMLEAADKARAALPRERVHDIDFERFVSDPMGVVESIVRFVGLEWDRRTRDAVEAYQRKAPPYRYGRIAYRYENLGIDERALRERLG